MMSPAASKMDVLGGGVPLGSLIRESPRVTLGRFLSKSCGTGEDGSDGVSLPFATIWARV